MLRDTPVCDFGWQAPDFTLNDPSGTSFGMRENLGENGLLIAFICNHCPYVKTMAMRFAADCQELVDSGINVLAVMSNDYSNYTQDSPENMARFAQENGFSFPYLVDETQAVGKAYGAICTPDFFGLNAQGALQYRGRLDDVRMGQSDHGRTRELVAAMHQIAQTGQGPTTQTPSMGCSIKWRA